MSIPDTIIKPADEPKNATITDDDYQESIIFVEHPGPKKVYWKDVQQHLSSSWIYYASAFGFMFLVWIIWFFFIATKEHEMTIERFAWERKIEVIDYQPRSDSGWSKPRDAYNVDRTWRYRRTDRVFSHYETRTESYSCGSYEQPRTCTRTRQEAVYKNVDVYDWYYSYTIDRWRHDRWIVTNAGNQTTPFWDDLKDEKFDSRDIIGNEQLSGKRTEYYRVYLTDNDDNRKYTEDIDLATWTSLKQGDVVIAHITRTHSIRSVDWKS